MRAGIVPDALTFLRSRSKGHSAAMKPHPITILAAMLAAMQPGAHCHGEGSEFWADTRFAFRWTDDLTFYGATGFRWDDTASSLARVSAQAGCDIRTTKYLTLSPS